ncbi:ATP-binding protein [uncultured Kocuria sp.]|uniref:ATP-binding protein n=1 Tax=uncultured Kocuria sp. TaxID=259305 RepID=UPI002636BDB9|nr:ATP-binding protein [uncultured Kocuria sp.]
MSELSSSEVQEWLLGDWRASSSRICLIEGFSGIGKTTLAQSVAKSWSPHSLVVSIEESANTLDDVLFEVASNLEERGCKTIADASEGDYRAGLIAHLNSDELIIFDHIENAFDQERKQLNAEIIEYLKRIEKRPGVGKILLLSSLRLDLQDQLPHLQVTRMAPFSNQEAKTFLNDALQKSGHATNIPASEIPEVVEWLGCNPRAMKAFIACLDSHDFEELKQDEPDTWALRHLPATDQLIKRLEVIFLKMTIDKLSPEARTLLESASVLRKPFKADTLQSITPNGIGIEMARMELSRLFILEKQRGMLTLNPVSRHLAYASLRQNPRRLTRCHSTAGDYYKKRAANTTGARGTIIAGKAFVEARHHFRISERMRDLEDLAGDFRRIIAPNYAKTTEIPTSKDDLNEYILVIQSVLSTERGGYHALRLKFAEALISRNQPGDRVLALRNLTIATERSRALRAWVRRVDLAAELDGVLGRRRIVDEAFDRLPVQDACEVAIKTAEKFVYSELKQEAIDVVHKALRASSKEQLQRLTTALSFVRLQFGQPKEAIKDLIDGYERLGDEPFRAYKLFEEGIFISLQQRDIDSLNRFRNLVLARGINDHQVALVDMLSRQSCGDYSGAARFGKGHEEYPSVVFQLAFSLLCSGDAQGAVKTLSQSGNLSANNNDVKCWLFALIYLCLDNEEKAEKYLNHCRKNRVPMTHERVDIKVLKLWNEIPRRIQPYPAFYFPTLPPILTGLDHDLRRTDVGGSALEFLSLSDFEFTRHPHQELQEHAQANSLLPSQPSIAVHVSNNQQVGDYQMGDTYNVENGGVVGKNAFNAGNVNMNAHQQAFSLTSPELLEEVRRVIDVTQSNGNADSGHLSTLYGAVESIENGDEKGVRDRLRSGGKWLAAQSSMVGTGLLTAIMQDVLGIQA